MRARVAGSVALVLFSIGFAPASPASSLSSVSLSHSSSAWFQDLAGIPRSPATLSFAASAPRPRGSGPASAVSVPDGAGGVYVVWSDLRDGTPDLFLQRVTNAGVPAAGWPASGVTICDAPGNQLEAILVPDGSNGVIVAWLDYRSNWQTPDGYIQRVNSSGTPLWTANGVKVLTGAQTSSATAAPDGAGGIYVAWIDAGVTDKDVFATRYDGTGALATGWSAAGTLICDAAGDQANVLVANDGAGGAYFTWEDPRGGYTNLYAQRFNGTGVAQWAANGVQVDASLGGISQGALASDPAHGAMASWVDYGKTDPVQAQYLSSAGIAQWTAGGISVQGSSGYLQGPDLEVNGSGGVFTWEESPGGIGSILAQRLDWTGATQWGASGVSVVSLAFTTPNLTEVVVDGSGNAFFAWEDSRRSTTVPLDVPDIYAQRVSSAGATSWTANGVAVCAASGAQNQPTMAPDGSGGVILVWQDRRAYDTDIYAQQLNSAGVPQLAANGVAVYTNPGVQVGSYTVATSDGGALVIYNEKYNGQYDIRSQKFNASGAAVGPSHPVCVASGHQIVSDVVSDGATTIVAWNDQRGLDTDIYTQGLDIDGMPLWAVNGVAVCAAAGEQKNAHVVSDGLGGGIFTWQDNRNGGSDPDIYAQRVNSSGSARWAANGAAVCSDGGLQETPAIASDNANGAIIAWFDDRNFTTPAIYAQRVDSTGLGLWTADGVSIAAFTPGSFPFLMGAAAGTTHDAIVTFQLFNFDYTAGTYTIAIGAQKVDGTGAAQWGATGATVCDVSSGAYDVRIQGDGSGGAYFGWSDTRSGVFDIYAQRLDNTGAAQWTANGVEFCNAVDGQRLGGLTMDTGGDIYLAWWDMRSGLPDIYAQRVNSAGTAQWAANGVQVCGASRGQYFASLGQWVSASPAREYISWTDNRLGDQRYIYLQRLDGAGTPQWTGNGIVGTKLALVSATAEPDRVELEWYSAANVSATVERLAVSDALGDDWVAVGNATSDGTGRITYVDRDVVGGMRYGYRLRYRDQGVATLSGATWVDVPLDLALAIEGLRPNPSVGAPALWFTLPSADPARLELIDVAGRRVFARDLTGLPPGRHMLNVDGATPATGLYFIRLTQNGHAVSARATFLK